MLINESKKDEKSNNGQVNKSHGDEKHKKHKNQKNTTQKPEKSDVNLKEVMSNSSNNKSFSAYLLIDLIIKKRINKEVINTKVTALIDTGAGKNYIDLSLAKQLRMKFTIGEQVTLGDSNMKAPTWKLLEKIKLTQENNKFTTNFNAMERLPYPIVLGMDWWGMYNPIVDKERNWVLLRPENGEEFKLKLSNKDQLLALNTPQNLPDTGIPAELNRYMELFQPKEDPMSASKHGHVFEFKFKEGAEMPKALPIYPLNLQKKQVLEDYVKTMLEKGQIVPSRSPTAAPVILVPKFDGGFRPCIDFTRINEVTQPDPYPLPLMAEIDAMITGCKFFTKLDLKDAFNQIPVKKEHQQFTAFKCHVGVYEYKVMPFGLRNAPAVFQRMISSILGNQIGICCLAYMDDILVFSQNRDNHIRDVKSVLETLQENDLRLKLSKCEFFKDSVTFLGNIIFKDGHCICPDKLQAIRDHSRPTNTTQVRSFMGTVNFLRKYCKNLSEIAAPLSSLQGQAPFEWKDEQELAFLKIKDLLSKAPVLAHPNPNMPYILKTDASNYAMGAVLLQESNDGQEHPIGYFSRKMSLPETNYPVYDKELLAIVSAMNKWQHYLMYAQHPVIIRTDHKALEYYKSPRRMNQRQARWHLELSQYCFKISYKKGDINHLPDTLSRNPTHTYSTDELDAYNTATMLPHEAFLKISQKDDKLSKEIVKNQKTTKFGAKVYADKSDENTASLHKPFYLNNNILYYKGGVWVPTYNLQVQVIKYFHEHQLSGHPGVYKTMDLIQRKYNWKGIEKLTKRIISTCLICARNKPTNKKPQGKLHPLQMAKRPWSSLSVDFIVGLPISEGYNSIMVVVDRFTKMAEFLPCNQNITAKGSAMIFLREIFSRHGLPDEIISDRGPQFIANFWKHLLTNLDIKPCRSSGYHPQSDGQTERVNQILEQYLRCYVPAQQNKWVHWLSLAQFAYNNTTHSSTKVSPFVANYGFHPKGIHGSNGGVNIAADQLSSEIEQIQEFLKRNLKNAIQSYTAKADKNRTETPRFSKDDLVMVRAQDMTLPIESRKLGPRNIGPYQINRAINDVAYEIKLPEGSKVHPVFHVSQLIEFKGTLPPSQEPTISLNPHEKEYEVESILASKNFKRKQMVPN